MVTLTCRFSYNQEWTQFNIVFIATFTYQFGYTSYPTRASFSAILNSVFFTGPVQVRVREHTNGVRAGTSGATSRRLRRLTPAAWKLSVCKQSVVFVTKYKSFRKSGTDEKARSWKMHRDPGGLFILYDFHETMYFPVRSSLLFSSHLIITPITFGTICPIQWHYSRTSYDNIACIIFMLSIK